MNTRLRTISIILTLVAVLGLLISFGAWNVIRRSIDKVFAAEMAVKQQANTEEQAILLQNLLGDVSPEIDTLRTRIIEKNGTVSFIDFLETQGRTVGAFVTTETVAVAPSPTAGEGFEDVVLTLSAQGTWKQVYSFLAVVESLPYKISMSSVILNKDTSGNAKDLTTSGLWHAGFTIRILKRK